MAARAEWEIEPHVGLGGRIKFGMEPAKISDLSEIYGRVQSERALDDNSLDLARDTLEKYGQGMSESEIAEFIGMIEQENKTLAGQSVQILSSGLQLTYKNNRISDIMADWDAIDLQFSGQRFFGVDPLPAILALQQANGGSARFYTSNLWFEKLKVGVFGFVEADRIGTLRMQKLDDEQGGDRTVTWGVERFISDDVIGEYQPVVIPGNL